MSFFTCSVCVLGNRTISAHELDDSLCAKTINVQMKEPEEGVDANVTTVMGENYFYLKPALMRLERLDTRILLELVSLKA